MFIPTNSYYGNFRTRTFSEIFPDVTAFTTFYTTCGIPAMLKSTADYNNFNINTVYALLISEYANSHIKSSDENRFKFQLMRIIYDNGAVWQRNMYLNAKIMAMTDSEMLAGGTMIYNHAQHPDTDPSTQALEELQYIDNQSTNKSKKDQIRAYEENMSLTRTNITDTFLKMFKKLFLNVCYPDYPLLYVTEEEENVSAT